MIKRLWEETWTVDNAGHLVLWLIVFGISSGPVLIYAVFNELAVLVWISSVSGALIATLWLFMREKQQWNCHIGDWDFRLGWPWQKPQWSLHKHMEYIPSSIGGCIVLLLLVFLVFGRFH